MNQLGKGESTLQKLRDLMGHRVKLTHRLHGVKISRISRVECIKQVYHYHQSLIPSLKCIYMLEYFTFSSRLVINERNEVFVTRCRHNLICLPHKSVLKREN